MLKRAILLVVCTLLVGGVGRAATLDTAVPPEPGEKYRSAEFRLWLPEGVKTVRGLIVRQHGCGRRGLDHADDLQWQALARKYDCGLLGSHFQQDKECADWFEPDRGSERAFFAALKTFAERSGHPELPDVPWALWGHSGGALWAMNMTDRHPTRVLAVFARSMAIETIDPRALRVPLVLNYGEQEKTGRFQRVHDRSTASFAANRPQGALWAVAVDPKSSHDCRQSRELAIPFFDAVLAERLPPANAGAKSGPIAALPIDTADAWLGNPETLEIAPVGRYQGDPARASWLPNATVARCWQEYVKTGAVRDTTPPPAPTGLKVAFNDGKAELTWDAVADLQSGIKQFHVYRDGKQIATVGGEKTSANKAGYFQVPNYGDEPEPRNPVMRYVDADGRRDSRYAVSAENHAGLESARSATAGRP